jgi:hypothetical protein
VVGHKDVLVNGDGDGDGQRTQREGHAQRRTDTE